MNQPKIERVLRLMMMMSGNVDYTIEELAKKIRVSERSIYRYIDTFKSAGLSVMKRGGNIHKLISMPKKQVELDKLVYFSEEEAYIVNQLINSLDGSNSLKTNLQRKLATIYSSTSLADFIDNKSNALNIEELGKAIRSKKKVVLKGYQSGHSGTTSDRHVEPFEFTANYMTVWAYDLNACENKVFKISRIDWVEVLEDDWSEEQYHQKAKSDCFRMNGKDEYRIRLRLSSYAKNLLIEEYPMAEDILTEACDGFWLLDTIVYSLAPVARFALGLADEVAIMDSPELYNYVQKFIKQHINKYL